MASIQLNAIIDSITIDRSAEGVPSIHAQHWQDAFYGLGWMHAIDRGGQIALMRTVAQGRLCELVSDSDALLELDQYFRRFALASDALQYIDQLQPPYLDYLNSYCQGVNEAWQKQFPKHIRWFTRCESSLQKHDVLTLIKLMSFAGLAEGQRIIELFIIHAIRRGASKEKLFELFPTLSNYDPNIINQLTYVPPLFPGERLDAHLPISAGSNAWVVSGSKTSSGQPILANDPHLEINRLPAVMYECCIYVKQQFVKGSGIPGIPGFLSGRTANLAWGLTYSCADTSDFVIERCKQGSYQRSDGWHAFTARTETFKRKQHAQVEYTYYHNENGILEGNPHQEGPHLCWNWTGFGASGLGSLRAFFQLLQCKDVKAAQTATHDIDIPTLHMVFADNHPPDNGNIGYQFTGALPRRNMHWTGLTPAIGWEVGRAWQGRLDPRTEYPSEFNPESGQIVITNLANQLADGPALCSVWLSGDRQQQIESRLDELGPITVEDMQSIQYDVVSQQAKTFLPEYLNYVSDGPIKQQLAAWDCRYTVDSEAAWLFERMHQEVILQVFGNSALGYEWLRYIIQSTNLYPILVGFFDAILTKTESTWLSKPQRAALLNRAIQQFLSDLPVNRKTWGQKNQFSFRNVFFAGKLPRILGFDKGPYSLAGNHACVHQGSLITIGKRLTSFSPCLHIISDLANAHCYTNLPGGASESRFSRWYASDIDRWLQGKYKKL